MTRAEAIAFYKKRVTTPGQMRHALAHDLFYLLLNGMNRTDINHDWLYARCREVEHSPDGHLDLWAREHYKSTIITVGLTIQEILNNPEITIGIFSHTRPNAKSFLRQIKREFESNDVLRQLFPHVQPPTKLEKRTWSEDEGLVVRRNGNPKEATIEAWGLVDGMPTGKHFTLMIYDDVVVPESVTTPEMIKKTTDAWRLSDNLGAKGGKIRMIGTRYHAADTYSAILNEGIVIPRIYPATVDGTFEGEPRLLTREELREKRLKQGPYVFACQMLQDPKADAVAGFREEWLRYFEPREWNGMNRYILVDPAGDRKKGSDYTVMWVVGLGPDLNYYLIDGIRDRLNLTQRARELIRLHRRYRPRSVGYEKYGMQADVEHVRYVQDRENYRFPIVELGGPMPKNDRIRRLVPLFEQRRFYVPGRLSVRDSEGAYRNLTEEFVKEEFLAFPVSAHDDMLDCLARILDPDLDAAFPEALPLESRVHKGPSLAETEWRPW